MFGLKSFKTTAAVVLFAAAGMTAGAQASTVPLSTTANGVTYTLTDTGGTSTTQSFTLAITGINGPLDTEGGRYGVNAFGFTNAPNVTGGSSTGFTFYPGGLNNVGGGGCNGTGNFFCFQADTMPTGPALTPDSSLSFNFTLTGFDSTFDWATWLPDFKIDWVGTKTKYNLVSQYMDPAPAPVPLPATALLLVGALGGLGLAKRRRRSKAA